jgi:hypothetical protein
MSDLWVVQTEGARLANSGAESVRKEGTTRGSPVMRDNSVCLRNNTGQDYWEDE